MMDQFSSCYHRDAQTQKWQHDDRYDRLLRRKRTFDLLCILKDVVVQNTDELIQDSGASIRTVGSSVCCVVPAVGTDLTVDPMPEMLSEDGEQLVSDADMKKLRRVGILTYIAILFFTHGESRLHGARKKNEEVWIEPLFEKHSADLMQAMDVLLDKKLRPHLPSLGKLGSTVVAKAGSKLGT